MKFSFIIFACTLLVTSAPAFAYPSFNSYWSGSYFFIDATNHDTREFICSVKYSFEYDDFGTRKFRTESGNFSVLAGTMVNQNGQQSIKPWSGNVLKHMGSWVRPEMSGEPIIQCN